MTTTGLQLSNAKSVSSGISGAKYSVNEVALVKVLTN